MYIYLNASEREHTKAFSPQKSSFQHYADGLRCIHLLCFGMPTIKRAWYWQKSAVEVMLSGATLTGLTAGETRYVNIYGRVINGI